MNKHDELAEIIDAFARTCDFDFGIEELLNHVWERMEKADEEKVYDLAASSSYLFESWRSTAEPVFVPRRMFFQGAEFRVTPTPDEVAGGYLLTGQRFVPFVSRDIFPPDAWLVLPDGSAPRVRSVHLPMPVVMDELRFFVTSQAREYLVSDYPGNERRLDGKTKGKLEVTVFDLQEFYAKCGFKPGDSLMFRVLDWLQGVYAVSHVPSSQPMDLRHVRRWTEAMRAAYDDMQDELGLEGDCYEQLSILMLLGKDDGNYPLMKNPPLSVAAFIDSQDDIAIKMLGNRNVFCGVDEDPETIFKSGQTDDEDEDFGCELENYFNLLGLPLRESDAVAYMLGALFEGADSPESVFARVCAGRSLFFRSAEDQEKFHALWNTLWEEVKAEYSPQKDSYGTLRAQMLALNDRCMAAYRALERRETLDKMVQSPVLKEFSLATASLSSMMSLFNLIETAPPIPSVKLAEMTAQLTETIEDVLKRMAAI